MYTLSILIPTYNDPCQALVVALKAQADKIEDLKYEILVADDGSTDKAVVEANKAISTLAGCRFIEQEHNIGRAAIRNFLGREAQYEWLLFLDCEVEIPEGFIARYLESQQDAPVVCGGMTPKADDERWQNNLRYRYERSMAQEFSAANREKKGCKSFRTTNFMMKRETFLSVLFDENIKTYGYEDVLFGKELAQKGICLRHIDNAVSMLNYEANGRFVEKTEEAMRTLKAFSQQVGEYSSITQTAAKLQRWHLLWVARAFFATTNKILRTNLCGNDPKPLFYKLYKLGYFLNL